MYYLRYGGIIPGECIGSLKIGMSFNEIREIVGEFDIEERASTSVIVCGDVKIWVSRENDAVTQILVFGDFKGKYSEQIGIGSTLNDVKSLLNVGWHEDLDVYVLDDAPGMCFELGDSGDDYTWDELTAPIETISVFAK